MTSRTDFLELLEMMRENGDHDFVVIDYRYQVKENSLNLFFTSHEGLTAATMIFRYRHADCAYMHLCPDAVTPENIAMSWQYMSKIKEGLDGGKT